MIIDTKSKTLGVRQLVQIQPKKHQGTGYNLKSTRTVYIQANFTNSIVLFLTVKLDMTPETSIS